MLVVLEDSCLLAKTEYQILATKVSTLSSLHPLHQHLLVSIDESQRSQNDGLMLS